MHMADSRMLNSQSLYHLNYVVYSIIAYQQNQPSGGVQHILSVPLLLHLNYCPRTYGNPFAVAIHEVCVLLKRC